MTHIMTILPLEARLLEVRLNIAIEDETPVEKLVAMKSYMFCEEEKEEGMVYQRLHWFTYKEMVDLRFGILGF